MARKKIYTLSDPETELLKLGLTDPDPMMDYFFTPEGGDRGWQFDYKFDPEGAYQGQLHAAKQKRITVIGGFGSGKTKGVGSSACVWSMLTNDFSFMNCAPAAWQSELMYSFIMEELARDTVFGKLVYAFPKRPYPKIELRFRIGATTIRSTMEFMSVDKNASAILSWEGDWVNIDEAGLIDDLPQTITNLGSRMRGQVKGRSRLGRMSLCSNSWDNPELWKRYDMAKDQPEDYLSITVSSRHNHNITQDQLRLMLKDIPEDEHDRFIDGSRPEGKGNYFSKTKVFACEDQQYGDFIVSAIEGGIEGFDLRQMYGAGVTYFTTQHNPKHFYMVLGDPGTGGAPNRNAPCVMVWDVTDFPKYKASLAAFYWGNGHGSITPFIVQMLKFMQTYDPIFTGVDNTGPQKNTSELLNTYIASTRTDPTKMQEWLGPVDLSTILNANISGMDFSGGRKPAYLIAGRLMIEAMLMTWPKFVTGMRSQLTNYEPEKDRVGSPKISQDIVATFCMAAWAIRAWFKVGPEDAIPKEARERPEFVDQILSRESRLATSDRSLSGDRF
jgi:hypothetical protein